MALGLMPAGTTLEIARRGLVGTLVSLRYGSGASSGNIASHLDMNEPRVEAVRKALHELARPLLGSTITPVVVFLPLIAVTL